MEQQDDLTTTPPPEKKKNKQTKATQVLFETTNFYLKNSRLEDD